MSQPFKSDDGIDFDHHWRDEVPDAPDHTDNSIFGYLLEFLPSAPFMLLDLGCGAGRWSPAWLKLGAVYEGIDASPEGIKAAKERHPDLSFYQMRAQEMDFTEQFDVVFCHTFLQHTSLESKQRIFPRVYGALKPGGLFIFEEKNDGEGATYFTEEGWIRFTEPFGFKLLRSTGANTRQNGFVFRKV